MPTQQHRLKDSVYALEDPAIPGLYYALAGERPRLTARHLATLAPAAPDYRADLCAQASGATAGQAARARARRRMSERDPLRPARGILVGLAVSAVIWLAFAAILWWLP